MANLHALPVPAHRSAVVQQIVAANSKSASLNKQRWTYLLANNMHFSEKADFVITLPKPQNTLLKQWIEKIIVSDQCALLFVEQLSLDEISYRRIQQLCALHKVTLINLLANIKQGAQVLKGPW